MSAPRKARKIKIAGMFTLTEIMVVAAIISSIPMEAFVRAKQKAVETECMNNMRQVGAVIIASQLSNGEYPKAAFYPENPKTDKNSIRVILGDDLKSEKVWLCPSMPDKLKEKGLTWVYNDTLGGKAEVKSPADTWILIEFSCVSKKAPAPHPGGYNIVYADGHVKTTKTLPPDITKIQQAALDRLVKEFQLAEADGRVH